MREKKRKSYEADPVARKRINRTWRVKNPGKSNAITAKRTASKLGATPAWLVAEDYERIAALYTEAARLTRETGVVHHVDHVIPLQGKRVSGLHVPWNLQILTAVENMKKGNKLYAD
jgi:5-methylcytosine-specific restriction endonuclease McrA